jgi:hypothetical protein
MKRKDDEHGPLFYKNLRNFCSWKVVMFCVGRGTVAGSVTRYGLDGPRVESP